MGLPDTTVNSSSRVQGHSQVRHDGLPDGEEMRSDLIRKTIPTMKYFIDCVFKTKITTLFLLFLLFSKECWLDPIKAQLSVALSYPHLWKREGARSWRSALLHTGFPGAPSIHHGFVLSGENKATPPMSWQPSPGARLKSPGQLLSLSLCMWGTDKAAPRTRL